MMVAHLGMAVFIIGVTMVQTYQVERDVNMNLGDTTEVGGYTFTFRGVRDQAGPNYNATQGLVVVTQGGREIAQMWPEKRVYRVQGNPMTEAAIQTGLTRDLYVALGQPTEGQAWIVRIYYKPFVTWIWGGCLVMALGGLLAASDRRYRAKVRRSADATTPVASAA